MNKSVSDTASVIIAQVNPRMPRTLGDSFIHVSNIHHFVEHDEPLLGITYRERSAIAERMARYVSQLVEDGATIQGGIGRITNSVLRLLEDKRDLGIHAEMITDAHLYLVRKGVITGKAKSLHRGKIIASFCVGSPELYDFVHNNPEVEFYPSEYVNDSRVISQNDQMVAINSALEIDLTGQVCTDSIGHKVVSGIGGYVDFMLGASRSRSGKSIIVLPSTSPDGRNVAAPASTFDPHLKDGSQIIIEERAKQEITQIAGKTIMPEWISVKNPAFDVTPQKYVSGYITEDGILKK